MNVIEVADLHKHYGNKRALNGIDLVVPEGEIVGFLGPNGAGKTTALRILLGLARPTSGVVRMFGTDIGAAGNAIRQQIGYLPDVPGFPPWMSAPEFLRFAGRLFGLSGGVLEARVESLLGMAGLAGVQQKIGGYSRGMKQRLGVAQALINAPRLLLLDEPTSALDPIGRKDVLTMIEALRGKATVLFSTHLLHDVERVCDSAAILSDGEVVTSGAVADLKARYGGTTRVRIEVDRGAEALCQRLRDEAWCATATLGTDGGIVATTEAIVQANRQVPQLVAEQGLALVRYEPQQASLEDVFVELVGREGER